MNPRHWVSNSPEKWQIPPTPPVISWVARLGWMVVFGLAGAWVVFGLYDKVMLGHLDWMQVAGLLTVAAWLGLTCPVWAQAKAMAPPVLHWFDEVQQAPRPLRLSGKNNETPCLRSHWRDARGRLVVVALRLDVGGYLLLRVSFGRYVTYHWLADSQVPGPWRWRIMAHAPMPAADMATPEPESQLLH